jgi:hypothetical protein
MSYHQCLQDDSKYGFGAERELKEAIEKYLDIQLQTTDKTHIFDYINEDKKILVELKSRRCKKTQYRTTMISCYKIQEAMKKIEQGYTIYLFFNFRYKLCIYELKVINKDWISSGGRWDRFREEINNYYFIPVDMLTDLSKD